ncbi:MAG: FHA domain-containing protein [Desulfosalsimonadaceae bacterium]
MFPVIHVILKKGHAGRRAFKFTRSFQIGRAAGCDIQIQEEDVSRRHAAVEYSDGQWWITDLESSNGIWINGGKVSRAPVGDNTEVEFGPGGPVLLFQVPEKTAGHRPSSGSADEEGQKNIEQYARHYFGDASEKGIGERTMMVRQAFQRVRRKQKRTYFWVIAVSASICIFAVTYAVYKHFEMEKQKKLAEDIFYTMKSLELEFAEVLALARRTEDIETKRTVARFTAKYDSLEKNYDRFVDSLGIYGKGVDEKEKTILRVARRFGECEINMPEAFKNEVLNYINRWRSTNRMKKALTRAIRKGYVSAIVETMNHYDLPPHFFYLALQESNFDLNACGPETRYGIAKGLWQFIPPTAEEYGLKLGPLTHVRTPDELDDRHDFEKSTRAAARYLRHIYDTDAKASGLLVIASYNWGQGRVNRLIRQMPDNPEERNFWKFLNQYRDSIPQETYDYVFYIFSAAVIGENPALFGFDFENPLVL